MKYTGKVWKYRADVNTDEIIPARYLNVSEPAELAKHCMEDIDKDFVKKMKPGDIIVADENFGCGSSREHAPISIKAVGISCVIAKSFARIFYRNALNIGLPIMESVDAVENIKEGDEVEIDFVKGTITNKTSGKSFKSEPFPEFMQELINAGGLMNYVSKKI
ncbi:3-isopropylmalate dehydratase small subunit [Candidatus Dependentiae bacterium]|nr:3-isopropylmalate dehydratase small subunit [Candidatus Dependentiae bacterium]